jgi:hypothetical protein
VAHALRADARTDRVDPRLVRRDRDLGAQARFARDRPHLHRAARDLRHFGFEQLLDEKAGGA